MTSTLTDEAGTFDVTTADAVLPRGVVLFSVGRGGDPGRHGPLLAACVDRGFSVVAPHFERLATPQVTDDDLLLRTRRLRLAADLASPQGLPVVGVGHSIGATALVALAGGEIWMRPGHRLSIDRDDRLGRLVCLAPATGFFQAPGALDDVSVPILAWAGTEDAITPASQAALLQRTHPNPALVDVRVENGAGHFTFMHEPPPQAAETHPDRDEFLVRLTADVVRFVEG